jgi:hypothetical protein
LEIFLGMMIILMAVLLGTVLRRKDRELLLPAPSGYRHGRDPEWNFVSYDRGFAGGGEVKDSGRSSPLPSFMSMGLGNMLMNRMQNPLEPFELLSQGKVGKAIGAQFGFADGGEVEGNEVDMAIGEAIEALAGQTPQAGQGFGAFAGADWR